MRPGWVGGEKQRGLKKKKEGWEEEGNEIMMLAWPPECISYYFNSWYGILEVFSKVYQF